jgi:hypothetical protein
MVETTEAINARLADKLQRLGLTVPTFRFGEDQLHVQEDAPRIVWVPRRGPTDANIKPAADHPSMFAGGSADRSMPTVRPLWRRLLGFEVHVWALREDANVDHDLKKDVTAAEQLVNHLVAAVHEETWGSYAATSEDWTKAQASSQRRGTLVIVGVQLHLAWTREADTLAEVTAMPIVAQGA